MHITRQHTGWALCAAFVLAVAWWELSPDQPNGLEMQPHDRFARESHLLDIKAAFGADLEQRVAAVKRRSNHAQLIASIEDAVATSDKATLATRLHELGLLAIAREDLDAAEVWLADALAEFEALGDERGRATVLLDQGRLHMAYRERARHAAYDYDDLLLSRWAVSRGRFDEASALLHTVVESSLALDRYATAASALTTLARLQRKSGDLVGSLETGQRALALHASAGNLHLAEGMLAALERQGLDREGLSRAENALAAGLAEHEAAITKLGLVRDYTQLYHQLLARGDPVSAWRYRRQAVDLRRSASRRALYRRQPDVLVELYRSNRNLDRAASVLRDAEGTFERLGMVDEMLQSAALQQDIR